MDQSRRDADGNVDEKLESAKWVAAYWGRSVRWVYDAAAAGLIPHRRIPGRRRVLRFVPSEIRACTLVAGPKPTEAA